MSCHLSKRFRRVIIIFAVVAVIAVALIIYRSVNTVSLDFIPTNIMYIDDVDCDSVLSELSGFHLKSEKKKVISDPNAYVFVGILGNIVNDNDVDAIDFHIKASSKDSNITLWYARTYNDSPVFRPVAAHSIYEGDCLHLLMKREVAEQYSEKELFDLIDFSATGTKFSIENYRYE